MNNTLQLLHDLGVTNYTNKAIQLIETWLENDTKIEKLLDSLGGWTEADFEIATKWYNNL